MNLPVGVIRPMRPEPLEVNHSAPSGPDVIPNPAGPKSAGSGNSVTAPLVVIRSILGE